MGKKKAWHSVDRNMTAFTDDQLRDLSASVPQQLDDTILLLIRNGDEPVKQYIYGDSDTLIRAGKRAGFEAHPLDEEHEPELPEETRYAYHPIIPWRARLNRLANVERLRTSATETRKTIETLMPPDSYVSVRLRHYGNFEQRRIRNWVSSEHNSVEDGEELVRSGAMCARVSAGAPSKREAADLAKSVGSALFPSMSNMSKHPSRPAFGAFAVTLAVMLVWLVLSALSPLPWQSLVVPGAGLLAAFLFAIGVGIGSKADVMPQAITVAVLFALLFVPNILFPIPVWSALLFIPLLGFFGFRWWRADLWTDIEQKPRRYWFMQAERGATQSDNETPDGHEQRNKDVVAYAVQRSTLLLAPMTLLTLYTPVGEASAVRQESHPVPELLAHDGIYLGVDQTGRKAYLQVDQLYGGITTFGKMGSGKSVLIHGIMQWADLARPKTDAKHWGEDSRIIEFAMKDDAGVKTMQRFRQKHWPCRPGDKTDPNRKRQGRVSYLADPNTVCPDMLGMKDGRNARETAASIAATMQYSFEQGDILNDSLDVITTAMTIAVAAERYKDKQNLIDRMHRMEAKYPGAEQAQQPQSPIGWCVMALAGGDGQVGSARALGHTCRDIALETKDPDMVLAAKAADQLYGRIVDGKQTIGDQRLLDNVKASRNKVRQFLDCEHVFTARRGRYTWEQVLKTTGDFHFVLAPHTFTDKTGVERKYALPERMDKILGKWLLYRLSRAVPTVCQGWQDAGKHTMFVCDELSMLADKDSKILRDMHDIWRAFGWVNVVASQYPNQLEPDLLTSIMGYSTFISLNTFDPEMAEKTAQRMTDGGEDGWTAQAIENLPQYTAAVRTVTQSQLQPAFIVKVHNFDGDPL